MLYEGDVALQRSVKDVANEEAGLVPSRKKRRALSAEASKEGLQQRLAAKEMLDKLMQGAGITGDASCLVRTTAFRAKLSSAPS